jgi:hypothetical protein
VIGRNLLVGVLLDQSQAGCFESFHFSANTECSLCTLQQDILQCYNPDFINAKLTADTVQFVAIIKRQNIITVRTIINIALLI